MRYLIFFFSVTSFLIYRCLSASAITDQSRSSEDFSEESTYFDKLPEDCLLSVLSFLDYKNLIKLVKNGMFLSIKLKNDPLRDFYETVSHSFPFALNSQDFQESFDLSLWTSIKNANSFKVKLDNEVECAFVFALFYIPVEEITNFMLEIPNNLVISNCDKIKDFIESQKDILIQKLSQVDETVLASKANLFRNYPQMLLPDTEKKNICISGTVVDKVAHDSMLFLIPECFTSIEHFMESMKDCSLRSPNNQFTYRPSQYFKHCVSLVAQIRFEYPVWYQFIMDKVKDEIEQIINGAFQYAGLIIISVLFDDEFVETDAVKEPDFDLETALKFIMKKYFNYSGNFFNLFRRIRADCHGSNIYNAMYRIKIAFYRHDLIYNYYNVNALDLDKIKDLKLNFNYLLINASGFIDFDLIICLFKKYKQDFLSKIIDKSLMKSILKRVLIGIYFNVLGYPQDYMISSSSIRIYSQIKCFADGDDEDSIRDNFNFLRTNNYVKIDSEQDLENIIAKSIQFYNNNFLEFPNILYATDFLVERHLIFLLEFFETFIEVYPEIRNESPEIIQEFFFNLIGYDRNRETLFNDYFLYYITLATF